MTPQRKRELREKAEGMRLMRHGGEEYGSVLMECLLEIERMADALVKRDRRIVELEATIADLRKPMIQQAERE